MVIQHNAFSYNAHRQTKLRGGAMIRHANRLSSGMRINGAADDAAGLAISEKMRGQIRGLFRAEKNASDGVALIQTADGALATTHNLLQRIRELAVQASNGTNISGDRQALQAEAAALLGELDGIADRTEYNTIKLLNGSNSANIPPSGGSPFVPSVTSPYIPAVQTPSGAGTVGVYQPWLRDDLVNNIAPMIVEALMDALPSLQWFSGSSVTVNLDAPDASVPPGGARAVVAWTGTDTVRLSIMISPQLLASSSNASGYTSDADRDSLHSTIAHEMMHLAMFVAAGYGMDPGGGNFPEWFKEGIAQAVGGAGLDGWGWDASILSGQTDFQVSWRLQNPSGSPYDKGYYAVMYLGYLAAGGGPVTGENIAKGIDKIMGELTSGKSLDSVINKYTVYASTNDYHNNYHNDAGVVQFVRDLVNATGAGAGSILTSLGRSNIISSDGTFNYTGSETFLKLDASNDIVRNIYPPGYSIRPGGGVSGPDRAPVHPDYDPEGDGDTGPPPPPPPPPPPAGNGKGIWLHIGPNANQGFYMTIEGATSGLLGVSPVSLLTYAGAQSAIDTVDEAISRVSAIRSNLGAAQNKLEHTIKALDIAYENISDAESRIRNTDMAKEFMRYIQENALTQSSVLMLSQANQQPMYALHLLRN